MAFRPKGSDWFRTRITLNDGRTRVFACGTTDEKVADDIERMIKTLAHKREWKPLAMVFDGKMSLRDCYDNLNAGELDAAIDAKTAIDISPLVDAWPAKTEKYRTQVRALIPKGTPFLLSSFTPKVCKKLLRGLDCSGATKNKYQTALSQFGQWLADEDYFDVNPMAGVKRAKTTKPQPRFLTRTDAIALVKALPMPNRAIAALMAACGVEWAVIPTLTRRDVDLDARSVHAQGTKTTHRNRTVYATEPWAWEIFADYARGFTDSARLFDGITVDSNLDVHQRVSAELNLPYTTVHDWRHTYAVQALRDGLPLYLVANQLGHCNTVLLQTTYGRFTPDRSDYDRHFDRQRDHLKLVRPVSRPSRRARRQA